MEGIYLSNATLVSSTCSVAPTREFVGTVQQFALSSGAIGTSHISGQGFGIAICKGIVAAHSGSIRIETSSGSGTAVIITLRADLPAPTVFSDANEIPVEVSLRAADA